jgi:hypothetical protein
VRPADHLNPGLWEKTQKGGRRIPMEWKITLHDKPQYVEVHTSGIADKDGSLAMTKELIGVMRKNRVTRALIDQSRIEKFVGEPYDVHRRPQMMKILGALLNIRVAEIIQPEFREQFEYLEVVFQSQGFKFQIFQERDEAVQWLFT